MNKLHPLLLAGLLASAAAQATPFTVDVSGAQSINLLGEAGNTVRFINIGADSLLSSLGWSVQLQAFAPSLLAEMQISFSDSSGLDLLTLSPALGDDFSGSSQYSGSLDLSAYGIKAGADGLLRIEFSEAYKDLALGSAEGQWLSGTLSVEVSAVPEPTSALLAALGLGFIGFTTACSAARRS